MRRGVLFLMLLTGCATVPQQGIRVDHNRIMRGGKALTEAFAAIDSFDVSESRGEVVFSAKRSDNFDIGLVSTDGSPISWVPADPSDEVGVRWAPRGNKIGYVVRTKLGDVVRTVHIPTSAALTVDFPNAKIESLAWDATGDQFAITYSTPDASSRVETMTYAGKQRVMTAKPAQELDVVVETFAPGAISIRPRDLRYNEKLPLVIWVENEPYAWSDARAELMRGARVAIVITRSFGDFLWKVADETAWLDASRAFVVNGGGVSRRDGTVAVAPAVVQSFAARFIAEELKRTGTPNGSSR
ncbi:MAG TPA: hypothetical protein VKB93_09700 [Thermoanaerobaculia bacterium]|nr:hypothetical protein [Thermoanaerobaculia bacterium]